MFLGVTESTFKKNLKNQTSIDISIIGEYKDFIKDLKSLILSDIKKAILENEEKTIFSRVFQGENIKEIDISIFIDIKNLEKVSAQYIKEIVLSNRLPTVTEKIEERRPNRKTIENAEKLKAIKFIRDKLDLNFHRVFLSKLSMINFIKFINNGSINTNNPSYVNANLVGSEYINEDNVERYINQLKEEILKPWIEAIENSLSLSIDNKYVNSRKKQIKKLQRIIEN